jgi:hypothetical protein
MAGHDLLHAKKAVHDDSHIVRLPQESNALWWTEKWRYMRLCSGRTRPRLLRRWCPVSPTQCAGIHTNLFSYFIVPIFITELHFFLNHRDRAKMANGSFYNQVVLHIAQQCLLGARLMVCTSFGQRMANVTKWVTKARAQKAVTFFNAMNDWTYRACIPP